MPRMVTEKNALYKNRNKIQNFFARSQKRYEAAVVAAAATVTERNQSGPLLDESSTSALGLQVACFPWSLVFWQGFWVPSCRPL